MENSKKGLSTSEKIDQYKKLKHFMLNDCFFKSGFCAAIQHGLGFNVYKDENFRTAFPDLYKHKPDNVYPLYNYWFKPGDYESRIALIDIVINELENEK